MPFRNPAVVKRTTAGFLIRKILEKAEKSFIIYCRGCVRDMLLLHSSKGEKR